VQFRGVNNRGPEPRQLSDEQVEIMHEESIVRALLTQVADIAEANQASCVTEIEVEIGPLSGVEPLLLQSAFERLTRTTHLAAARLQLTQVQLRIRCQQCWQQSDLAELQFQCPHCQSNQIQILRGDEVLLANVTLQTTESGECPTEDSSDNARPFASSPASDPEPQSVRPN
jgi:hydrogenase nickel incorporation protein HypA/HybF